MKIKEIKKLDLKDGDILFIPSEFFSEEAFEDLRKNIQKAKPLLQGIIIRTSQKAIQGIKVISLPKVDWKDYPFVKR